MALFGLTEKANNAGTFDPVSSSAQNRETIHYFSVVSMINVGVKINYLTRLLYGKLNKIKKHTHDAGTVAMFSIVRYRYSHR